MTPVFGHGRLRLYLLKLLDESPRHGYEIIQQLKERFAGLYSPSAGTVYPRLARLESEGLVRHETDGGRKIYHITDSGRAELAAKAGELAELETEIRNSVRDLAEGIREEVRESARTVQEELANAAREAQRESGRPGGGRDSAPFPFGPGGPLAGLLGPGGPLGAGGPFGPGGPLGPDGPLGAGGPLGPDGPLGPGASGGPAPTPPPPESVHWSKEEWREWKQQQREQWRDLRRDWQRSQHEQRGQLRDAQRAWKDQWVRQWKEQWQDQARQWSNSPPPWAWWTGSGAGPGDTGSPEAGREERGGDEHGRREHDREGRDREQRAGDEWARHRGDWERFGPQLRELFGYLRREGGTLLDAARRHGPLGEAEMRQAHSIIDEALRGFRDLFGGPGGGGTEPADRAPRDAPPTEIVSVDEEPSDEQEPKGQEPTDG